MHELNIFKLKLQNHLKFTNIKFAARLLYSIELDCTGITPRSLIELIFSAFSFRQSL